MVRTSYETWSLEAALKLAILLVFCGTHNVGVTALKCHHCGWDSCGTNEELVECTLERVNQVHVNLQRLVNLSQYHEDPNPADFMCFELRLTNAHGNRSGTVKSCTLQSSKMCDIKEWQSVKVVNCNTCNDRDYCNGFKSPARDDSGVGFSFSMPSRSGSPMSNSPALWSVILTATVVCYMCLQIAKRW